MGKIIVILFFVLLIVGSLTLTDMDYAADVKANNPSLVKGTLATIESALIVGAVIFVLAAITLGLGGSKNG